MIVSSSISERNIVIYYRYFMIGSKLWPYNEVKLRRPENISLLMKVSWLELKSLKVHVSSNIRSKINNKYVN
jgi:hypothetical protein